MSENRSEKIVHVEVGKERKRKFRQYCLDTDTNMTGVICDMIDELDSRSWQPVDTAKDGVRVLVDCKDLGICTATPPFEPSMRVMRWISLPASCHATKEAQHG